MIGRVCICLEFFFFMDLPSLFSVNTQDSCKKFKNAVEELTATGDIEEVRYP